MIKCVSNCGIQQMLGRLFTWNHVFIPVNSGPLVLCSSMNISSISRRYNDYNGDNAPVAVCWAHSVCFVFTWSIIWYGYIALKEPSLPPLFLWGFRTVLLKTRCKIRVCLGCHLLQPPFGFDQSRFPLLWLCVCRLHTPLVFISFFLLNRFASVSLCAVIVEQFGHYL